MISTDRKYIKVWVEKRLNPPKKDGARTYCYTLEWKLYGKRFFRSLGPGATKTFALAAAKEKEAQLNSIGPENTLIPISWKKFRDKFLEKQYPGYDMKKRERDETKWANSVANMREDRRLLDTFQELVKPTWCHQITSEDRETYIQKRMPSVGSGETINKDLKILRKLFNVLEDWKHRENDSNPFSGPGNATIGVRRKRHKQFERKQAGNELPEYYNYNQVSALLQQADNEVKAQPNDWSVQRLRALIYFVAYTGARIREVLFLEWTDLDLDNGIAWLRFRSENMLKTEGSEAPLGLSAPLVKVMTEWKELKRCTWVFPNSTKDTPWVTGGMGYRPLDQLQELALRAEVGHATFKMFRDTLATLGKSQFGLSEPQVQALLRHTTTKTQVHYTHDELVGLRANANAFNFNMNADGSSASGNLS